MPAGEETTVPEPVTTVFNAAVLGGMAANAADTERAADMVTAHVLVPEQPSPLHPVKLKPEAGEAAKVTGVPPTKLALQLPVQLLMPAGVESTLPEPLTETVRVYDAGGMGVNVAVTERAELIVTGQVRPEHDKPLPCAAATFNVR